MALTVGNQDYQKIITEIRWRGSARFYDVRGKLADKFVPTSIEHWRIKQDSELQLHDPSEDRVWFLSSKHGGVNWVRPRDFPAYRNELAKWISAFESELDTNTWSRIGFRSYSVLPVLGADFDGLRDLISETHRLDSILPSDDSANDDVSVSLEFSHGEAKGRLIYGPMISAQLESLLGSGYDEALTPDLFVFLDIDYSLTPPNFHRANDAIRMVTNARDYHDSLAVKIRSVLNSGSTN